MIRFNYDKELTMKDKVLSKKNLTFLMFIILIIICLIILLVLKNNKENSANKEPVENAEEDKWYVPGGDVTKIDFYYNELDGYFTFDKEGENTFDNDPNYKILGTYNCSTSTCQSFGSNVPDDEVIILDGKYLIYNYKENKAYDLNLPNANYSSIEFLSYEGKDYGLSVSNINGMYAFYSLEQEAFTTDFKYTNIFNFETAGLVKGNISTVINNGDEIKYYIVSYKDGNVIKDSNFYLGSFGNGKNVYYYENYEMNSGYDAVIYDDEFNDILDGNRFTLFAVTESGNLVAKQAEENSFSIYNKTGTLVKKSKDYKDVSILLNDYAAVIDNDDYLKIIDVDANVVSKCMKMDETLIINDKLSGVRKKDDEDGIFVRVSDINDKQYECFYMLDSKEKGITELSY